MTPDELKEKTKLHLMCKVNELRQTNQTDRESLEEYQEAFRYLNSQPWFIKNRQKMLKHLADRRNVRQE
jgi:hypothetical protein